MDSLQSRLQSKKQEDPSKLKLGNSTKNNFVLCPVSILLLSVLLSPQCWVSNHPKMTLKLQLPCFQNDNIISKCRTLPLTFFLFIIHTNDSIWDQKIICMGKQSNSINNFSFIWYSCAIKRDAFISMKVRLLNEKK